MRMSIKGHRIEDFNVYIFVQTHLQRKDLPPIEYNDAEERAEAAVSMYRDCLKIAPQKIKVIKNATKAELLALFSQLQEYAEKYENEHKNNIHSIQSFFFSWIGFRLKEQYHPYLKDFDIDWE